LLSRTGESSTSLQPAAAAAAAVVPAAAAALSPCDVTVSQPLGLSSDEFNANLQRTNKSLAFDEMGDRVRAKWAEK